MKDRGFIMLQRDAADLQMLMYWYSLAGGLIERMSERGADTGELNRMSGEAWSETCRLQVKISPALPHAQEFAKAESLKADKQRVAESKTKRRRAVK